MITIVRLERITCRCDDVKCRHKMGDHDTVVVGTQNRNGTTFESRHGAQSARVVSEITQTPVTPREEV